MIDRETTPRVSSGTFLGEVLTVAQRRLARGLARTLAEESCTVDEWRVMRRLRDGEGHLMGELAEVLLIPHPTLTRLVDGLVEGGLVYRRQSTGDRRKVAVHLSRRGHDRLQRLDALAEAHERAFRSTPEWEALGSQLG